MRTVPERIPIIDVSPIVAGRRDAPAARDARERVLAACAEVGFMTITGHGVERSLIDATVDAAERFFALPDAAKRSVAPRRWNPESPNAYRGYFPGSVAGKEGLDVGEPSIRDAASLGCAYHERNLTPEGLGPEWTSTIASYFEAMSELGAALLRTLVEALAGEPERVDSAFARPRSLSTLRFNFYPERDEPVAMADDDHAPLSCEAHVDSGLLTLLYQDDRGGLQVQAGDGRWHAVRPDADAFVVNTGWALQRMTGRTLVATRHRVLFAQRRRLSIPFFFEPIPDFVMDPGSLGLPYPSPPEPQVYESFLRDRVARFAEYQR